MLVLCGCDRRPSQASRWLRWGACLPRIPRLSTRDCKMPVLSRMNGRCRSAVSIDVLISYWDSRSSRRR